MHSLFLQITAVLAATAVSTAEFLEKDVYLRHAAPKALGRIEEFRTQEGGSLTHAQAAVLDLTERVVKNFATDEIGAAQSMCESAFTKKQCHNIFTDDSGNQNQKRELILGRRSPPCSCSTATDFCIGAGNACVPHDQNGGCAYAAGSFPTPDSCRC